MTKKIQKCKNDTKIVPFDISGMFVLIWEWPSRLFCAVARHVRQPIREKFYDTLFCGVVLLLKSMFMRYSVIVLCFCIVLRSAESRIIFGWM